VNYVDRAPDLAVCGEANSVNAALELFERLQPDIVVTDLSLAHRNGFSLIEDACARYPLVPILVHSMHSESFHAAKAFRVGAAGYVMKGDSKQLLAGIRRVLAGELVFSERVQREILNHLLEESRDGSQPPLDLLTGPERELFELCGCRADPAVMAHSLQESPTRVSELLTMIAQKLRIANEVAVFHTAILWFNAKAEKREMN